MRSSLRWARPVGALLARAWSRIAGTVTVRWKARYGDDVWEGVLPAVEVERAESGPEPVPLPLTPEQALRVLHGQHPHLQSSHVRWHFHDGAVFGEVNSLDVDEDGQRRIVNQYAAALAAEPDEVEDGIHITVSASGVYAAVKLRVAAVLIHDPTMPLPAYREAAGTLSTQAIPDDALTEAVGAR